MGKLDHKDAHKPLYNKYCVTRADGRDAIGEKHEGCSYFVLDLDHDPHAIPAIRAYIKSCEDYFPNLAWDLHTLLEFKEKTSQEKEKELEKELEEKRRKWTS